MLVGAKITQTFPLTYTTTVTGDHGITDRIGILDMVGATTIMIHFGVTPITIHGTILIGMAAFIHTHTLTTIGIIHTTHIILTITTEPITETVDTLTTAPEEVAY